MKLKWLGGLAAALMMIGLVPLITNPGPPDPPPTTTTVPTGGCGSKVHYFRHDLPEEVNHFGPSAPDGDVAQVLADMHNRRCTDPALTVAHRQYSDRAYTSPEERLYLTEGLASNQNAWTLNVLALEAHEKSATKVEIVTMTERYRTLYMNDDPTPRIFQDVVDRPSYKVIRFTYSDGHVDNFKLDCGYQPVEPMFPGIPGPPHKGGKVTPSGPTPTVAPKPPTTCDPRVCKGPDREPAPCRNSDSSNCGGLGDGGTGGTGGGASHGPDGYSPQDPAPPPIVTTVPAPPSTTKLPATSVPPIGTVPPPAG